MLALNEFFLLTHLADSIVNFMGTSVVSRVQLLSAKVIRTGYQWTYRSSRFNQIFAPPAILVKFSAK
jgi:hypothetical protein